MANTTNFNWATPDDTDLVKDGAAAIRTLGSSIDTSFVDLKGGTTGQVLSKASNTDLDYTWVTTDDANAIQNAIVDAKGDLIAASANDTPARLAVGNNGETLVADSSTTTGLRYNPQNALANPVINGGFDIWQRGTSFTSTGAYGADRWWNGNNATATFSRQTTGDTTNLPNIQYCLRLSRNNGATATDGCNAIQSFETVNSIPFAGKAVTVSFYARKGALLTSNLKAFLHSGTGTDQFWWTGYTGDTQVGTTTLSTSTLTTTWQRFVFTGTVPTTSTELTLQFNKESSGTAGATDYAEITGVQIDLGTYTASTAPTFRRSGGTIAGELAACQRYYFRSAPNALYGPHCQGTGESTTTAVLLLQVPTQLRITAASVDYSALRVSDTNAGQAVTALVLFDGGGLNAVCLRATVASGLTQYRPYLLTNNNNAAGYVAVSAEL